MSRIRIDMSDLSEMMALPTDKQELANAWITVVHHGFMFNEFSLFVTPLQQVYKVVIDGLNEKQVIHIKKTQNDDYGLPIKITRYDTNAVDFLNRIISFLKKSDESKSLMELYKTRDDDMDGFIDIVPPMSFIQYMMVNEPKRKVEYVQAQERKGNGKPKKSYNNPNKIKEYTLLDCIKIYEHKNKNRKPYEYKVESFPRRGGVRHMASGKLVPYSSTVCKPQKGGKEKHNGNNYKLGD